MSAKSKARSKAKALLKIGLAAVVGMIGIGALVFLSRSMAGITQSEDTADALNIAAQLPGDLQDSVTWLPDNEGLPREMEPLTREIITDSWLRGWSQIAILARTGSTQGLVEYFSNSAQDAIVDLAESWDGLPVYQIGHELELTFYSEDGSVAAFTSRETRLLRSVPTTPNSPKSDSTIWYEAREAFQAVILLEDGNWRVQHLVRIGTDGTWWSELPEAAQSPVPQALRGLTLPSPIPVPVEKEKAAHGEVLVEPEPLSPEELLAFTEAEETAAQEIQARDLDHVVELGLDTVRISLNFDHLDGRYVTPEDLEPVLDFLGLAAQRGIGVIVTLFDDRLDHRVLNWDADDDHLAVVVPELAGHPALLMWDLQDGPDQSISQPAVGVELMHAWVTHVSRTVRELDSETPTTITWHDGLIAAAAPKSVDVISFAHNGDPAELDFTVNEIRRLHPSAPIMLGDFGIHSWNSVFPGGLTETEQAVYAAEMLNAANRLGLLGSMTGPLWDFAEAPPGSGFLPTSVGPAVNSGVLRVDGSPKAVAEVLTPGFDFGTVQGPTFVQTWTKPFRKVILVMLGMLALLWWVHKVRMFAVVGGFVRQLIAKRRAT